MEESALEINSLHTDATLSVRIAFHIAGAAPPSVFNYVSDPHTVPLWQSDALSQKQLTHGIVAVGTLFENRKRFLGYRFRTVMEVTAYDPPSAFAFRSESQQRYAFIYHFVPSAGGTDVKVDAEFPWPGGIFALVPRRFLRRAITSELQRNHLALKGIFERAT